jgi:hypothetical protein
MTDPAKVLDDLIKGLILFAYDFVRLSFFGLILPLVKYWNALRKVWPFLTMSMTKRLSAMTYLVIWIVLVVVSTSGSFFSFASSVFGLPSKGASDYGFSVPIILGISLMVAVFVDLSLRLVLSGIQNRVRRDLYGAIGRIAVANIFCGIFIVATIENYRTRNEWLPLFEPIPALIWPVRFLTHWIYPANPVLSLFAVTLVIMILKAYAIRDLRRRALIAGAILVFVPAILINVTLWSSVAALFVFVPGQNPASLEYALGRCTVSSGKLHATAVMRLLNQESMVIDPHVFVLRSQKLLRKKDGTYSQDVGTVDGGQPPLILSQSKPLVVREEYGLALEISRSGFGVVLDFAGKRGVGPRFLAF